MTTMKTVIRDTLTAIGLITFLAFSWDAAAKKPETQESFETTHERLCRTNKHYAKRQGDLCLIKITPENIETIIKLQPYRG